jgi:hypothetical protein
VRKESRQGEGVERALVMQKERSLENVSIGPPKERR